MSYLYIAYLTLISHFPGFINRGPNQPPPGAPTYSQFIAEHARGENPR